MYDDDPNALLDYVGPTIRKVITATVSRCSASPDLAASIQKVCADRDYERLALVLRANWGTVATATNGMMIPLVPAYLDLREFWEWLMDTIARAAADEKLLRDSAKAKARAHEVATHVVKPTHRYGLIFVVEYLDLGRESVRLGDVTFSMPTAETRSRWAAEETMWGAGWSKKNDPLWSIAEATANAVDAHHASLVALPVVSRAMNRAKVAAFAGDSNVLEPARFQWRLTGEWRATPDGANEDASIDGWFRPPDKPLVIPMGATVSRGLDEGHSGLALLDLPSVAPQLRAELDIVVRWVARSLTEVDEDEQIVQLATALESLLLPDHRDGKKGELLALRYHLLGGAMNPAGILDLYERRSDVVHEGDTIGFAPLDLWRIRLA
ncbi:MAG: hypothetical protein HY678_09075, partial [Chloroflexi bacterium]|nr:hypothetical protein [Chloroflexota bacterium]